MDNEQFCEGNHRKEEERGHEFQEAGFDFHATF